MVYIIASQKLTREKLLYSYDQLGFWFGACLFVLFWEMPEVVNTLKWGGGLDSGMENT